MSDGDFGYAEIQYAGNLGYVCPGKDYGREEASVLCKEAGYLTGFPYQALK